MKALYQEDPLSHQLKRVATEISETTRLASVPLANINHRPRSHGRSSAAGLALVAMLVIGVGTYVATTGGTTTPHARPQASSSVVSLTGGSMRLAAATIRLPEGFHSQAAQCAPTPAGLDALPFVDLSLIHI